ncbi:transglutaminase-like cysteine peptidase [Aurantimonas sp. VKM B-3413]|uniref:transglutaminase-like cysteine peptidase n=1 Tax=Aurantimonas sp. VKM B-3413 TaxID=2779401 RepID=UPI001E54510E|nr:transglutaminase-like cysteine peptidase [Aurantimonas sp. VKM B-3413]MCB8837394.1 transglutaminase-like cysteine peptidase [Aurantimonas sp. VKM B-3413]
MGNFRAIGATALLCLAATFGTPAAAEYRGPSMVIGTKTTRPIGHEVFCRSHEAECRPLESRVADRALELTPAIIIAVAAINTAINAEITPKSDKDIYGVKELWTYPETEGDCEDFALLKRRMLHEKVGIDLSDLLMTVVRKRNGEGHAILTLRTTAGDFVLDNLNWRVLPWSDAPYRFLKRQDTRDPGQWVRVEDGGEVLVGAVKK